MLHEFLTTNSEKLIDRCRAKVAKRPIPPPTAAELTYGIPIFLNQIIKTLRLEETSDVVGSTRVSGAADPARMHAPSEIGASAAQHGDELHRGGFTVDQVVHDYGDLCQAVTDLAVEQGGQITPNEFRTLNRCLDNAGLSISQRGVEANGGRLDVRNKPGTGCVFIIDLPMAPALAGAA